MGPPWSHVLRREFFETDLAENVTIVVDSIE
jgi:hypothetical protein